MFADFIAPRLILYLLFFIEHKIVKILKLPNFFKYMRVVIMSIMFKAEIFKIISIIEVQLNLPYAYKKRCKSLKVLPSFVRYMN